MSRGGVRSAPCTTTSEVPRCGYEHIQLPVTRVREKPRHPEKQHAALGQAAPKLRDYQALASGAKPSHTSKHCCTSARPCPVAAEKAWMLADG